MTEGSFGFVALLVSTPQLKDVMKPLRRGFGDIHRGLSRQPSKWWSALAVSSRHGSKRPLSVLLFDNGLMSLCSNSESDGFWVSFFGASLLVRHTSEGGYS